MSSCTIWCSKLHKTESSKGTRYIYVILLHRSSNSHTFTGQEVQKSSMLKDQMVHKTAPLCQQQTRMSADISKNLQAEIWKAFSIHPTCLRPNDSFKKRGKQRNGERQVGRGGRRVKQKVWRRRVKEVIIRAMKGAASDLHSSQINGCSAGWY